MSQKLVEAEEYWILPIEGREVTRCLIDYAFGIELWAPGEMLTFRIGGSFIVRVGDQEYKLSPEGSAGPTSLAPALALLHETAENGRAYKDGRLQIAFRGGDCLSVEPDSKFESWEAAGDHGIKLVCLPGGSLAVWQSTG